MHNRLFPFLLCLGLGFTGLAEGSLAAQDAAKAPLLPASETAAYTRELGGHAEKLELDSRAGMVDGKACYQFSISSSQESGSFWLDASTLRQIKSDLVMDSGDAKIRTITTLLEDRGKKDDDSIRVSGDGFALAQTLRSFPWGEAKTKKVSFAGVGRDNSSFSFTFSVLKKENLKVGEQTVECYFAQLQIDGFWSTFVSPTKLWYAVAYPHYLVRSEGASGPPGSPLAVLILNSYSFSSSVQSGS